MQFFDGLDPEETQEAIRSTIKQFDQRTGHLHEHQSRSGEAPRHRFRLGDREVLRSKLTEDHLRNDRKHERQGDPDADSGRLANSDRFEQWPERTRKNRLGNETKHQRRHRDTELRSGEHKTQALVNLDCPLGLAVAAIGSLDKLRTPRCDERKLSCNKISVRRDQDHDAHKPESNLH